MELEYIKVEKQDKKYGHDCPYNEGCRCPKPNCYSCGRNPIVAKMRMDKIMEVSQ